ncbi:MAG: CapA family protein [Nitrosopumilus sp.]|nr:CapA family protein [Nitrosopumilus sp.]
MKKTDKMKMEAKAKLLPNKSINSNLDLTYDKNIGRDFKILFAGDISFAENYVLEYSSRKNIGFNIFERYGYDYFFQKLKPLLLESDLVIANLETPLIDVKNTVKPTFSFSSRYNKKQGRFQHWSDKTKTVEYLKKYNILNVSLANNHMMDYGIDGLNQTLDILKESGIRFLGAGVNRRQAGKPYTKNIFIGNKMVKLAVISAFEYRKGYDKDFSFYASDRKGGVNRLSINRIHRKIEKLREDHGNNIFVVVLPHWGGARNYGMKTDKQTEVGHQLVNAGADIVIGSGPHNFQQIDEYKGRLILYSIANFLYNSLGNYDNYNASPFSLAVRLVFQLNDRGCLTNKPEQDNADNDISLPEVKKTIKIYPIMTDNIITKWQARLLEEQEFKIAQDLLMHKNSFLKSSKRYPKAGIDKIGRYMELKLD